MGKAYFKITFKKNFSLTIQPLINIVQASIPVRGAEEKKGGGGTAAAGGQASHKRGRHSKTASHQRRRPKTISPTRPGLFSATGATVLRQGNILREPEQQRRSKSLVVVLQRDGHLGQHSN